MSEPAIRFDDGAAYEEFMGRWSRPAGDLFLEWLAPSPGLSWVDVGCGNGAFTERVVERCAPVEVQGIDPSEEQLAFARTLLGSAPVHFRTGDAMALPYADDAFDVAAMALVIFFVPEPANGVAEMTRVVKPGGLVSAYTWDMLGSGFPYSALHDEMAALGSPALWPPSYEASRMDVALALWADAGLVDIETREITVQRTYADFETFWSIAQTGPRIAPRIAAMGADDVALLRHRLKERLVADDDGRITYSARANAIKGVVPG